VTPAAERYRARLLRYANRLTLGDPHRAEDIVQETMLRAWIAARAAHPHRADVGAEARGDDGGSGERAESRLSGDRLAAWLYTVARNLAVDARRRERSVPMGVVPAEMLRHPSDTDLADVVVTRQLVQRALARLSPEHREVLVHVHLRDRSRADAARVLGVPQGTVKSRTHYALLALRRELPAA
jgi:RNA polymerase sigma-70 factor (ECF subfamily)